MFLNEPVEFSSAVKRKGSVVTLLFFLPSILQVLTLHSHPISVVLRSIIALSGQINYVFYPAFLVLYIGGPLIGLPLFFVTVYLIYKVACMLVIAWEKIFDHFFDDRSKLYQVVILVILLIPFIYSAIYIPSLIASRFTVEANTPLEISISKDVRTFYDENGPFDRYILKEFIVRNDNDFQMTHEVPRGIDGVCLYDTRTGTFGKLGGYYAHEDGHGFVDPGTWNTLILGPKSEARYYLLGDKALSDKYDEILLSRSGSWESGKYCDDLTRKDVDGNKSIDIIKISK